MKIITGRLDKLDKIENATEYLSKQMSGVLQRTTTLEEQTGQNSNKIKELMEEIKMLKSAVASQEETIAALKPLKEEIPKLKTEFTQESQEQVQEFKRLIGVQQKQVDGFHDTNNKIQAVIQENVTQYCQEKIDKWTRENDYNNLKNQANRNKNNLVIIGLQEEERSAYASASDFISSTLGIKNVKIDIAYRLGSPPPEGSTYARPILMRFTDMADRNRVWRNKIPITSEDGQTIIRIQQDLPKKLREDAQILHRVLKAAATYPNTNQLKLLTIK